MIANNALPRRNKAARNAVGSAGGPIVCGGLAPSAFREAILAHGAVMLRGAAHKPSLRRVGLALDRLYENFSEVAARTSDPPPAPDGVDAALWRQGFWEEVKKSHIYDAVFKGCTKSSYFDILRVSGIWQFVALAFPETEITESFDCTSRRVLPDELRNTWDSPADFHVDAQFFYDDRLSINFWIPLVPCGVEAPGLTIIRRGVAETRQYLEHNRAGYEPIANEIGLMHHFRCHKMWPALLVEHAGPLLQHVWMPEFAFGDVLAFTNFTIHASYCSPTMTQPRTSLEIRVDLPGYRLDCTLSA